jgi:3-phosphoshikimate 1-carboxyvinyltransferase
MAGALRACGIRVDESHDGAVIEGGAPHGGQVDSHGDHRIAMATAVLAQCAAQPVRIADVANVATSFPGFLECANAVGMGLAAVSPTA